MRIPSSAKIGLTVLVVAAAVRANTEPPPPYDARSVGLGSTGVAHASHGSSLFHNPAGLDQVEQGAVTGSIALLMPQLQAPLAAANTEVKSERTISPLFLVGGAYRVGERVTVGLAVFPTMGFGARYREVAALGGSDLAAQLGAFEIAPGVALAPTKWLAVGLAYRATYMMYTLSSPTVTPTGVPVETEVDLSGWNFTGAHLGLLVRATDTTRVGLTYRSKVTAKLTGTTEMGGDRYDSEMEFSSPHTLKLGVAQFLLDEALLLALDLKLWLFKDSGRRLVVSTEIPGAGRQDSETRLDWRNSLGACAGGEYRLVSQGPALRGGYCIWQSATPGSRAQPLLVPPGLFHSVHLGGGIPVSRLEVDLGGYYTFGGEHAEPAQGLAGDYTMNGFLVGVGASYRI